MTDFRTFIISPEEENQRLDVLITCRYPDLSRTRIQSLIREGHITLQGSSVSASQKTLADLCVEINIPPSVSALPQAQKIDLDIVFEDCDLLVINKPAGMVVHPAPGSPDQTLVNALLSHCGDSLSGIGGIKRPGIVHRLDKGTSGLLVVAKNDKSHHGLSEQFASRTLARTYQTLVWGVIKPLNSIITGFIGRSPHNRQKMAVLIHGGKKAITHYKTLEIFGNIASLIECKLETGRTHQIRVHLTAQGHSIMGDPVYGKIPRSTGPELRHMIEETVQNHRPFLHASCLEFIHPHTYQKLKFTVPLPQDFEKILKFLKSINIEKNNYKV